MRIEGDTLHAKTGVRFFLDEKFGIKPFTVRMVSEKEWDEIKAAWTIEGMTHIQISSSYSGDSFRRQITRIWKIGELVGFVQIAIGWRHVDD
ncbi:MAG: hypothetical protein WBK88_04495 [Methanothrix sp.]